nr:PREDICTED: A-kinase anchor protein 11-like [Paralichthys olivaceus]
MQAATSDSGVPEPNLETRGIPAGLRRTPPKTEALERFAQNMAENIIQPSISQREMVEPEVISANQDQETLGEVLASAVVEDALREVCAGCNVQGFQSSGSAGVTMDDDQAEKLSFSDGDFVNMDTEMDPVKELHTFKDTPHYHPALPVMGSLDYPDAPPTTPLLPELERSRDSFARKLKGGLAKVFLPSPPPTTPKEKGDDVCPIADNPRVELMEHLMNSLSAGDLVRDWFEAGAKMEDFAEALSCDVIDWVFRAGSREQIADDGELHRLAQQLAETVITSSLDEAVMSV